MAVALLVVGGRLLVWIDRFMDCFPSLRIGRESLGRFCPFLWTKMAIPRSLLMGNMYFHAGALNGFSRFSPISSFNVFAVRRRLLTHHGDPGGDVDRVDVVAVDEGVETADGGRRVERIHLRC